MWIARHLQNDPAFPRPIIIGTRRFWDLTEVEAYEQALLEARRGTSGEAA
jgi:hypothetical protein